MSGSDTRTSSGDGQKREAMALRVRLAQRLWALLGPDWGRGGSRPVALGRKVSVSLSPRALPVPGRAVPRLLMAAFPAAVS